ncbi:MAG: DUF3862 domain-containing protein [Niameybacter sp.]
MSKETKIKKPFYKKWWAWVIAIIIVVAIASPSEEGTTTEDAETPVTQPTQKEEPVKEPVKEEPKAPKVDPNISKAEFDKIVNGMTYEEVVAIIGGNGEVMSEVGVKGDQFHTIMYTYEGEKGFGSNANFTFQAGKLQAKAQLGLQ